jgi:enoyl-CoA hydratase/carnithine racemase
MKRVEYSVDSGAAIISMNRTPVNAIDHEMIDEIHDALLSADADNNVHAAIITSSLHQMFCGGMDLRMIAEGGVKELREFVYKFYMKTLDIQYSMRKPTIAAIMGPLEELG